MLASDGVKQSQWLTPECPKCEHKLGEGFTFLSIILCKWTGTMGRTEDQPQEEQVERNIWFQATLHLEIIAK